MQGSSDTDEEVRQLRRRLKETKLLLESARSALNVMAQGEFAAAVAAYMREGQSARSLPIVAELSGLNLFRPQTLAQKKPAIVEFYKRHLAGMEARAILEIGVKRGGSLAMWRHLFPGATVVGLDLDFTKATRHEGIEYVQGDQRDLILLSALGARHGPFDLVIDDGSHIPEDQLNSLDALAPHMAAGGLYVVEDIHFGLREVDEDEWTRFLLFLSTQLRRPGPRPPRSTLALEVVHRLVPRLADVILADKRTAVIAFRFARQSSGIDGLGSG